MKMATSVLEAAIKLCCLLSRYRYLLTIFDYLNARMRFERDSL